MPIKEMVFTYIKKNVIINAYNRIVGHSSQKTRRG